MLGAFPSLLVAAAAYSVRVCTNTACKRAASADTLEAMHLLASVSREANCAAGAETSSLSLTALQAAFAASHIGSCGCLGGCGSGPNCVLSRPDQEEEVFYDVYKPAAVAALLEEAELHVRDDSQHTTNASNRDVKERTLPVVPLRARSAS